MSLFGKPYTSKFLSETPLTHSSQRESKPRTNIWDLIIAKNYENSRIKSARMHVEAPEIHQKEEKYISVTEFNSFAEYITEKITDIEQKLLQLDTASRIKTMNSERESNISLQKTPSKVLVTEGSKSKIIDMEKSVLALKSNFRKFREELCNDQKSLLVKLEELYNSGKIKTMANEIFNKEKLEIISQFNDVKKTVKFQLSSAFTTLSSLGSLSSEIMMKQDNFEKRMNNVEVVYFENESVFNKLRLKGSLKGSNKGNDNYMEN